MVLKVYGYPISASTRCVLTTLQEKSVPYELVIVDFLKREHQAPDYVKIQPFAQIPYINDDGFILFESRAICRYIENKYKSQGPQLVPTDLKELALFDQAASIEASNYDAHAVSVVAERLTKAVMNEGPANEAIVSKGVAKLGETLDVYDNILSKQKYLAGEEFSLVDIFHLGFTTHLNNLGYDFVTNEKRPNVIRWWKDITSRESWQVVLKIGQSMLERV